MSTVTKKEPSAKVTQWKQEALLAIGRVPTPSKGQLEQIKDEALQQVKGLVEVKQQAQKRVDELRREAEIAEQQRIQLADYQSLPENRPIGKEGQEEERKKYQERVDRVNEANAKVEEAKKEVSKVDAKIKSVTLRAEKVEQALKTGKDVDVDEDPDMERAFKIVLAHQIVESRDQELTESYHRFEEAEKKHKKRPRKKKTGDDEEDSDPEFEQARNEFLEAIAAHDGAKLAAQMLENEEDDEATPVELDTLREKSKRKAERKKESLDSAKDKTKIAREGVESAQKKVDKSVREDPALTEVVKNLDEARQNLEEKQKELVENGEGLDALIKDMNRFRDALSEAGGEKKLPLIQKVREASGKIAEARKAGEVSRRAANTAKQQYDQAVKRYEEAVGKHVEENPRSAVAKHTQSDSEAQGKLRDAQRLEDEASEDHTLASGRSNELDRRAKVLEELPKAKLVLDDMNKVLKKHNLENTPIWTGATVVFERIGESEYNGLVSLATKLRVHYDSLQTNGATPKELEGLYKDFPEKWLPPRFREDEKNWSAVVSWFSEEDSENRAKKEEGLSNTEIGKKITEIDKTFMETAKTGLELPGEIVGGIKSGAEGIKAGIDFAEAHGITTDILKKGKGLLEEIAKHMKLAEEDMKGFEEVAGPVGKFASLAAKGFKAVGLGIDMGKNLSEEETEDPIEQLMREDEMLDCLKEIGKLGAGVSGEIVALAWKQIPGLDVGTNMVEAQLAFKNMAERLANALADSELREEAEEGGHRLEPALGQMATRGKHLAAREGTDAALATLNAAAGILNLTGIGAKVGVGLKGVAAVGKVGKSVGVIIVDKSEAQTAKNLLDQAQAGNGDARRDLFRHHPRYAKGILAVMASEGDSFAIRCLENSNLTEDMIRKSSPKIIKRYLLKRFGETDEGGTSWSETWESVKGAASYIPKGLVGFANLFVKAYEKILIAIGTDDPKTWLATLNQVERDIPESKDVNKSLSDLKTVRRRRNGLADTLDPDKQEEVEKLAALDKLVDETTEKVEELRKSVEKSMETMEQATVKAENAKRKTQDDDTLDECIQASVRIGGTITEMVVALAEA
jgi:hypothetical protein